LCQQLQRIAPSTADTDDLITCLKTLVFCEVAPESSIMKTVLQLIKSRVNELRIQNFSFISHLLNRVKNPLADALTIALPVVFETQLETQLDPDNVKNMCECLRYAIDKRMPVSKVKFIADSLLANTSKWENSQLLSVILSLGKVRYLSEHGLSPLLEDTLSRLAKEVNRIERRDLIKMAIKTSENYSSKSQYWYNEEFCNATAQRVVQEQWPFTSTSEIGRSFSKFSYVNFEFLDHYSSLIDNISFEKLKMHPRYLLAPFADASYKSPNMEKMVDFLLTSNQSTVITNLYSLLIYGDQMIIF
jgi:FAST kinase domain-containing protein 2